MDDRPIGIFDSGLGGLTALRALERLLPGEDLIYFGDSANAPYGTRSPEELRALARANTRFLTAHGVKAILVACGTVSSTAMDAVRAEAPELPVFDVLEAPCVLAAAASRNGRVAVAATEATVRSGAFARRLGELDPDGRLAVYSKACQSLVLTAERGHFSEGDPVAEQAVAVELEPIRAFAPDTLLLACTHFPLFESLIAAYVGPEVRLISVSDAAAEALRDALAARELLSGREQGRARCFTSGDSERFSRLASVFLGHPAERGA